MRRMRFLIALALALGAPASSAAQARGRVAPSRGGARDAVPAVARPLAATRPMRAVSPLPPVRAGLAPARAAAPLAAAGAGPAPAAERAEKAEPAPAAAAAPRASIQALARSAAAPQAPAAAPSAALSAASREDEGGSRAAGARLAEAAGPDVEAARAAADELFDARRRPLQADDRQSLLLTGYRFEDGAGRVLEPGSGRALTRGDMDQLAIAYRMARSHKTMLRLADGAPPEEAARLKQINRDALPRELLRPKADPSPESAASRARAALQRRLASLHRRLLGLPGASAPETVSPHGAELEEKLGALFAAAIVRRLEGDAEGRRLLDELRDEEGRLRLPTVRVLRLEAHMDALYVAYGRQLIVSFESAREQLLARLPAGDAASRALLDTEAGLLEYVSREPRAADRLAQAKESTFFHELVHFKQDLERPLQQAVLNGDVPDLVTLEMEYEAYFRQNLYIHSRLQRAGASLDIDRVDEYVSMLGGFDGWKAWIDGYYRKHMLNSYESTERLASLQERAVRLGERLLPAAGDAARAKLRAMSGGSAAVAAEKRAVAGMLQGYRARAERLAQPGFERIYKLALDSGELPVAADSARTLAALRGPGERDLWERRARAASEEALRKLETGEGLELSRRIDWINAMSAYFDAAWPHALYVAALRDYPEHARRLKERPETAAQAAQFEENWRLNRDSLRDQAEGGLSAFFADPAPDAGALAEAESAGRALGDAELADIAASLRRGAGGRGWDWTLERAADRALIRLADGSGMSLRQRIDWVNALVNFAAARGERWKRELWEALIRDYPEMAAELRREAEALPGSEREDRLERAEGFQAAADERRAQLRARAEENLALARASRDEAERARALDAGAWQARTIGDAALAAEFEALSRAGARR